MYEPLPITKSDWIFIVAFWATVGGLFFRKRQKIWNELMEYLRDNNPEWWIDNKDKYSTYSWRGECAVDKLKDKNLDIYDKQFSKLKITYGVIAFVAIIIYAFFIKFK